MDLLVIIITLFLLISTFSHLFPLISSYFHLIPLHSTSFHLFSHLFSYSSSSHSYSSHFLHSHFILMIFLVFVRGPNDEDLSVFISKIIFSLHPSFTIPIRGSILIIKPNNHFFNLNHFLLLFRNYKSTF